MGDMGDYWRDVAPHMQAESQRKLASNREQSAQMLSSAGIPFESKNGGAHLIVAPGDGRVFDFWPGTGLFQQRGVITPGRGVRRLIKQIKGERHDN